MMLLHLFACLNLPAESKTPPPDTPAASLSAAPQWSQHNGYAPGLPQSDLSELSQQTVTHQGPVVGGLLLCEVSTTHRGDRQRFFAARRGIDTTLPDINTWMSIKDSGVLTQGVRNSATSRASAPTVHLETGDTLQVSLMDQGFISQHTFDTLSGEYTGAMPITLTGANSTGRCTLAAQAAVDAKLKTELAKADVAIQSHGSRVVDLSAHDFGRTAGGDPNLPLRASAALVGWAHTEVAGRVAAVADAETRFEAQLTETLSSARAGMPSSISVGAAKLSPRAVACGLGGYTRHGLEADCVLPVEIWADPAEEVWFEWIDTAGRTQQVSQQAAYLLPPDADRRTQAELRALTPGEHAVLMIPLYSMDKPIALRVWKGTKAHWVAIPAQ